MASLKVNVPACDASSPAFRDALKVLIALEAYGVEASVAEAAGSDRVELDLPKEQHKKLIEANAIVRYIASASTSMGDVLEPNEAALIEWQERNIANLDFSACASTTMTLNEADALLSKAKFPAGSLSPAQIVLFGALYPAAATIAAMSPESAIKTWFDSILNMQAVVKGIERAAVSTSTATGRTNVRSRTKNVKAKSAVNDGAAAVELATDRPRERKIKAGTAMTVIYEKEILPRKGERNILVTSALPYVNNVPHLGNIIGSVLSADVFARYNKARNRNTLYICGTDEYGTATETKALEEGISPRELCDKFHAVHAEVYKWFEIGFDKFGRTATEKQTTIAQDIFTKLHDNGFLSEKTTTQLYDETHGKFLADRFVEGICPDCGYDDARGDQCDGCGHLLNPLDLKEPRSKLGGKVIVKDSNHIFLSLDKLQAETEAWAEKSAAKGRWSSNGVAITRQWLKQGLNERCITRDLVWGTPVPLESMKDKVLYVWFDATIGYISITANYTDGWQQWWQNPDEVELYQFMGKDNVPFHTVVFPASLIGTREAWTMLHHISTTEYLQYEGGKFSKSRNIGVFGNNAQDTGVPPSVWRYYLLSSRPETSDAMFAWSDFILRNNAELLANLGNYVNRIVKFVNAKYAGIIPDFSAGRDVGLVNGHAFVDDVNALLKQYIDHLEACRERAGLSTAMAISSRGNQFLQDNRIDNTLFANEPERCASVVGHALNLAYVLAAIIWPFMPSTAENMCQQLNAPLPRIPEQFDTEVLQPGHSIGKAAYLFSRIDEKKEEEWRAKYGGSTKK
ncbi:methionine--tRNA ligase mes1 [Savitreella phatthalungensis]